MPGWRQSLTLLLAALLAGGHIAGLQVAAWSGMLIARSAEQGLEQAIATTFDGLHPCAMCLAAQSLRSAEDPATTPGKTSPEMKPVKQPDLTTADAPALATSAAVPRQLPGWAVRIETGIGQPQPEPPPPQG